MTTTKRKFATLILSVIMALVLCVCIIPMFATTANAEETVNCTADGCTGTYANGFCTEDGTHFQAANLTTGKYDLDGNAETQDEVYEIGNAGQLYWFASYVNAKTQLAGADTPDDTEDDVYSTSANAVLTADIVVNAGVFDADGNYTENGISATPRAWTPIGKNSGYYYTGIFDGTGHTIKGLYDYRADTQTFGLFGYTDSTAAVKNVGVTDTYFYGYAQLGGICAENKGTIYNCYQTGRIIARRGSVGGICGYNAGTVEKCKDTGTIVGIENESQYVGGIVARLTDGARIKDCVNEGTVLSQGKIVGGICGQNGETVEGCVNRGSVYGAGEKVGGISGYNTGVIQNCVNEGDVTGTNYVGGVCGHNSGYGAQLERAYVLGCGNSGEVRGTSYVGGVAGFSDNGQAKIVDSFNVGAVLGDGDYIGGICGHLSNTFPGSEDATNVFIEGCFSAGGITASATAQNVGGICGSAELANRGKLSVTGCYYDSDKFTGVAIAKVTGENADVLNVEGKTTLAFITGEVATLLNGVEGEGTAVWGQAVGAELYPKAGGEVLYPCVSCTGEAAYTNDSEKENATGVHTIVKNEKAATCAEDGWGAYYECVFCHTCYEDGDGTQAITDIDGWKQAEENKISKLGH